MSGLVRRVRIIARILSPCGGAVRNAKSDRRVRKIISWGVLIAGLGLLPVTSPAQVQTFNCPDGFGPVAVAPPILLSSLKTVPNPVIPKDPTTGLPTIRADLAEYIRNLPAAIQLGKALFWDMQAGSDNKTACATCHFHAGADRRNKNQLNPGPDSSWNVHGANYALGSQDFPFTLQPSHDNVAGSQGIRKSTFQSISKSGAELTASVSDSVFNVNGANVRQVTGINSPSVINAVFNHRQFWNGRAQPDFNGVNPWGSRDTSARVWVLDYRGYPVQVAINIKNASLASQAVGPALNPVEMSAAGRTFPELGKKLLLLKPLGLQAVSSTDSVLGGIADTKTGKGLKTTYTTLIQTAFQPKWWNTNRTVSVNGKSYTMMQANFSLYWGIAIMLYEATLVSDDTPIDRYLDPAGVTFPRPPLTDTTPLDAVVTRLQGDFPNLAVSHIQDGLALFELPVGLPPSFPPITGSTGAGCIGCHFTAELTSASVRNLSEHGLEPGDAVFKGAGFDLRLERMFTKLDWTPPGPLTPVPQGTDTVIFNPSNYAINVTGISGQPVEPPIPLPVATYDAGWYNLGVRPTADDPGVDGTDPFGKSLSWTKLFQALPDPSLIKVPGGGLACPNSPPGAPATSPFAGEVLNPLTGLPLLAGPLLKNEPTDVAGTFKTAALRNVEFNGPYFHNGGKATLRQVVEFYDEGGDFANPTKAPTIVPLFLEQYQIDSLVAFLVALTDERVRWQKAPFDHPQIFVPNGAPNQTPGTDSMEEIPAVGAAGSNTPLQRFLSLNPFQP